MLFFFKGHSNQYTIPGHSCSKGLIVLLTTLSHNYTCSLQSHLTTGYVIQLSKDHARKRYKYVTTEEQ